MVRPTNAPAKTRNSSARAYAQRPCVTTVSLITRAPGNGH